MTAGCNPIIGVDVHDGRLETAARLEATHMINSSREDAVAAGAGIDGLPNDDGARTER